jgi:hypothetical protein
MATIGRNKAIAQSGKLPLSGILAWFLWLTVHLLFLVKIRRRFEVFAEWAWAYVTWHRGSRLIVDVPSETTLTRSTTVVPIGPRSAADQPEADARSAASRGGAGNPPPPSFQCRVARGANLRLACYAFVPIVASCKPSKLRVCIKRDANPSC